jgi:hypothetical protein
MVVNDRTSETQTMRLSRFRIQEPAFRGQGQTIGANLLPQSSSSFLLGRGGTRETPAACILLFDSAACFPSFVHPSILSQPLRSPTEPRGRRRLEKQEDPSSRNPRLTSKLINCFILWMDPLFDHEKLDVYCGELGFVAWLAAFFLTMPLIGRPSIDGS